MLCLVYLNAEHTEPTVAQEPHGEASSWSGSSRPTDTALTEPLSGHFSAMWSSETTKTTPSQKNSQNIVRSNEASYNSSLELAVDKAVKTNSLESGGRSSFATDVPRILKSPNTTDIEGVGKVTPEMTEGESIQDKKEGLIDIETKDLILEIVNCYFIPIVCPFGLMGNIFSLVVLLCLHKGNNSTNVLLVALTVSDLGYVITTLMRKLSCVVSKIDPERGWWLNIIFLPQVYMFNRVFNHVTSFTTMVISIERFVAVVWPFKVYSSPPAPYNLVVGE
ncbi:FMRFamide receptor [Elysia marginata]|uniref:FMRFamide receptor n=1 Tax=Elysia marginata TaxID=1093978 RepID=A0AAV4EX49_9GAST|nr:FMRFamide receptor [Elysia marginata]